MNLLRLAFMVFLPGAAVAVAASCSPVVRPPGVDTGGTGGGGTPTTSSDATTAGGGATCVDTLTDPANCGGCGNVCSAQPNVSAATCVDAICALECAGGFLDCNPGANDGCEADPAIDPLNCSACGVVCGLTQTCAASACADTFTTCADIGTCADAACEEPGRYSVDTEIAVDLNNGRTLWMRATSGPLDYLAANDYCVSSLAGGVSGWRIPTGAELGSIVFNAGGLMGCGGTYCNPATDQAVFNDTSAAEYWTSDPYMDGLHFCVSFCDGRITPYKEDDTSPQLVRCVHDPLP